MVLSALTSAASQGLQTRLKGPDGSSTGNKTLLANNRAVANEIFTANLLSQTDRISITLKSLENDIKRLQGFKVKVTPADAKQLAKFEDEITRLEARAGPDGLTSSQIDDRADLYKSAYKILGKEFVDIENDPDLKDINKQINTLLEPKLRGPNKDRLDRLRKLQNHLEISYIGGNKSQRLLSQLNNVLKQISDLVPPRLISELSPSETREYDGLVEKLNNKAGVEMVLPSRKRSQIEKLQSTMSQLGG